MDETSGFKDRTRVGDARERLRGHVDRIDRTETVAVERADGRALAESITAGRDVPGYERAAMDGFAVRATDTHGAGDRSPAVLRVRDTGRAPGTAQVDTGEAVRVHTGSEIPDGADAVVMVEHVERVGEDLEVFDAVAEGENVAPAGEDVAAGQHLYDPGHRLRPSDLGLLKSVGVEAVEVVDRPEVAVIPTGEELVQDDPGPGEVVETNGITVSRLVERWGGQADYRDIVTDDEEALRAAVTDGSPDIVVTTGGSSVGERDLVPDVVDGVGEVFVHGIALKPGHPCALGTIGQGEDETPALLLPGYPVACIVNAVQFLRPAVKWAGGYPVEDPPTVEAVLDRKLPSEPGIRTFVRVRLENDGGRGVGRRAIPTRASGSGVLSSVALADGWVVVSEDSEGIDAGATVDVQDWERLP